MPCYICLIRILGVTSRGGIFSSATIWVSRKNDPGSKKSEEIHEDGSTLKPGEKERIKFA